MPKPPTIASLQRTLDNLTYKQQYAKLSPKRKKLLARIAKVHANKDNSKPDVVVSAMRKARRAQVMSAATAIAGVLSAVGERGKERLLGVELGDMEASSE
jgi:hypothetical protein